MPARTLVCLCLLLASCGTVRDWRYLRSDPMPVAQCYDGIVEIAAGEFAQDPAQSDRGEGVFVSRWRQRVKDNRHLARNRVRVELVLGEGSAQTGWPVRFYIEQETVKDLRRDENPREEDWSADGQDAAKEALFQERLLRKIAPKSGPLGADAPGANRP